MEEKAVKQVKNHPHSAQVFNVCCISLHILIIIYKYIFTCFNI